MVPEISEKKADVMNGVADVSNFGFTLITSSEK